MLRLAISISLVALLGVTLPSPASGQMDALDVGDIAPQFEALTAEGEVWRSADVMGDKYLVVYFFPAAMTGGCTAQACAFRDNRTKLKEMGAEVVGISGDRVEGLQVFKRANNLNFPLLSDEEGNIARSFGVPVRDGGKVESEVEGERVELVRDVTTARWTFIVGLDGEIVYRDTEVDAAGDSERVVAALERLRNAKG